MLGAARISNDFGPVSEGLRFLGIKKEGAYDEFERVGLDRYKHTKDWLNAANA